MRKREKDTKMVCVKQNELLAGNKKTFLKVRVLDPYISHFVLYILQIKLAFTGDLSLIAKEEWIINSELFR